MEKKLFTSAMAIMMLVIILSASITVSARPTQTTRYANGLLIVHVYYHNQTDQNATVNAIRISDNSSYIIPFNSITNDYRKSIPPGVYVVSAFSHGSAYQQDANISAGQTRELYFWF